MGREPTAGGIRTPSPGTAATRAPVARAAVVRAAVARAGGDEGDSN